MKKHFRMKKLIAGILVVLLMLTAVPGFAAEEPSADRIRLGYFEFGGMFEGASEGAKKSGYCYEYMMQISVYTGWNYEFCYGTYAELYEKLKNGEIDILPYTNYNDQRGAEVLFSDIALAEEEYYIAMKRNGGFAPGVDSLKGASISTLEGADYNDLLLKYIEENGLDMKVKYYPDLEGTWNALRDGTVDATVFTSNAYSTEGWDCVCSFGKKPTYIAVAKDRPDLLEKLNEASDLSAKENPAFLGDLYANYFSDNPFRQTLTQEELAWFSEHPVLHVGGFTNDAPYIFSIDEENHTATGLTVDVIQGIIKRLKLDATAEYRAYDTMQELEDALNAGEIDVIMPFYPSYSVAEQHNLIISNTVRESNMELVYKTGTLYAEALKKIATPVTKLGVFYVQDNYPDSEIVPAVSIQDAVDKVRSGEATGAIAQNVVMHNIKEKYDDLGYVVLSGGCGTCFAARPENYPLIRILNRGLNYFTNAEISAIASQYTLEPNVTTRAYLAAHSEVVVLLVIIFLCIVGLAVALLQMNRQKRRADEASRSKTAFLFNMSHDIRTPMNAITGFTDKAIRHRDDPAVLKDSLEKVKDSSAYLLRIINDILDMAKIESGKLELNEELHDADKGSRSIVGMFGAEAAKKGIDMHTSLEARDTLIWVDENRVSQIIANLVSNAIKYTDPGGDIWYSVKQLPCDRAGYGKYALSVKDTGHGMSEEFLARVFDAFERDASAIQSGAQGTGLGMAIVKKLADAMNGTIDIESEPGVGTTVTFTAEHRIATPEEAEKYRTAGPGTERTAPSDFKGKKVLLVEDNELNREIASDLLDEQGMLVETAENGSIALEMLGEKGPDYYDFILMDIQMPVMGGYEATARIREKYPDVHIPVIALSANAFAEDKAASLAAGMDDHVAKPINMKDLFCSLEKFL